MAEKTITLDDGRTATIKRISIAADVDGQEQIGYIPAEEASTVLDASADELVASHFVQVTE